MIPEAASRAAVSFGAGAVGHYLCVHSSDMNLSEFISTHDEEIIREWETFARAQWPAAVTMSPIALRDHAGEILAAIVDDLQSPQGKVEQFNKSQGYGSDQRMGAVGTVHAALRIESGFTLAQLVAEYRALRATVLRRFERAGGTDLSQVTRFNEAIDAALAEAATRFMVVLKRTHDEFLAVLGHDLRNPLSAVLASAALIAREGDKGAHAAARIVASAERMRRMVNDLLDLTRTRLGAGLPMALQEVDLEVIGRAVLSEFDSIHPYVGLEFHSEGDLRGYWDPDRLAQVLSNLIGNALQHGDRNRPVEVGARVDADEVVIDVHNEGSPIPGALLANIFEPMVRHSQGSEGKEGTSLGLGLHIVREVAVAHGGTVTVTSTASEGTTFSVRLPRRAAATPLAHPAGDRPDQHDASGKLVVPPPLH